jgi:hypothetical protein
MSDGARILQVVITTPDGPQVIRINPEAEGPVSVLVETSDGKRVTVSDDSSTKTEAPDGQTVTVDASGETRIRRPRRTARTEGAGYSVRLGHGVRNVQVGDSNTQVNY